MRFLCTCWEFIVKTDTLLGMSCYIHMFRYETDIVKFSCKTTCSVNISIHCTIDPHTFVICAYKALLYNLYSLDISIITFTFWHIFVIIVHVVSYVETVHMFNAWIKMFISWPDIFINYLLVYTPFNDRIFFLFY